MNVTGKSWVNVTWKWWGNATECRVANCGYCLMDIARKCLRQCGQIPSRRSRGKFLGQCWWNVARRCLQIIHLARDNHLHTHPPATHICGAGWLCRWRGNASIGIAHLPHNALRGHVPVPNECHGKAVGNVTGKVQDNAGGMPQGKP